MSDEKAPKVSPSRSTKREPDALKERAVETLALASVDLESERLANAMRRFAQLVRGETNDPNVFFKIAGELVITECLRVPPGHPDADAFFERPDGSPEQAWYYSARISNVADTLFMLRLCDGFDVFCAKLRERNLRSAYSELLAARMFLDLGFTVGVRREVGAKGKDFDFEGRIGDLLVNVEVTALDAPEYSSNTIINALEDKRKQVPKHAPAVIYVIIPEPWFDAIDNLDQLLFHDVDRFFRRGTKRINAVVVLNERHVHFGEHPTLGMMGQLVTEFHSYVASEPRHPVPELAKLIDRSLDQDNRLSKEEADANRERIWQDTEFYNWAGKFWTEANNER